MLGIRFGIRIAGIVVVMRSWLRRRVPFALPHQLSTAKQHDNLKPTCLRAVITVCATLDIPLFGRRSDRFCVFA